jgi:DNA-binding HxlR family transcriptional regulator
VQEVGRGALSKRGTTYKEACACRELLDLLATKWSASIIAVVEDELLRFGELRRRLDGISSKVLVASLRRLEAAGLLTRSVYPEVPAKVAYSLTALGRNAIIPLSVLRDWAASQGE